MYMRFESEWANGICRRSCQFPRRILSRLDTNTNLFYRTRISSSGRSLNPSSLFNILMVQSRSIYTTRETSGTITRKYSVKQRFLVYRFLESCTKVFDQTSANITQDLGKDYDFEPTDALTSLFKTKDSSLEDLLIGRTYYVLKYFVGMKGILSILTARFLGMQMP